MKKELSKVIAPDKCPEYLTPGKVYDVIELKRYKNKDLPFSIVSDYGATLTCFLFNCAHLNGENWIIAD